MIISLLNTLVFHRENDHGGWRVTLYLLAFPLPVRARYLFSHSCSLRCDVGQRCRVSVFKGTPLMHYLRAAKVKRVIICGLVSNFCVLATTIDALSRGFTVQVPPDCVGATSMDRHEHGLRQMGELGAGMAALPKSCLDLS